jgi:hypothetical protein
MLDLVRAHYRMIHGLEQLNTWDRSGVWPLKNLRFHALTVHTFRHYTISCEFRYIEWLHAHLRNVLIANPARLQLALPAKAEISTIVVLLALVYVAATLHKATEPFDASRPFYVL